MISLPTIAIVERQTRLTKLKAKRATAGAASFEEYADEGQTYDTALKRLRSELDLGYPIVQVDRAHLPNFDFGRCVLVVVVGQDGLVANAAKYVGDLPIIAVNPDPVRNDGVLLPFNVGTARRAVQRTIAGHSRFRSITLAQVQLNDGQELLAFNDFFIGAASHVSARYTLQVGRRGEAQSSSGVLVSTGAGSTGWMSSVFHMAAGIAQAQDTPAPQPMALQWEDRRLIWAVREPFLSKHSSVDLIAGMLDPDEELIVESLMPANGVIFSDGIEADRLEFNSGAIARVSVAKRSARLAMP